MRQLGFEFIAEDIALIIEHNREAVEKMLFILKVKIEEGQLPGHNESPGVGSKDPVKAKETARTAPKPLSVARQLSVKKSPVEKKPTSRKPVLAPMTSKNQKTSKYVNAENEVSAKISKLNTLKENIAVKDTKVNALEKVLDLKEKQLNALKQKLKR